MESAGVPAQRPLPLPEVDPGRGSLLGVGAVLLAAGVVMLDVRFQHSWANGTKFVVELIAFAILFGLALRSPRDGFLAWRAALVLSALAVLFFVIGHLAQILGADSPFGNSGTLTWMAALYAAIAGFAAVRFRSVAAALVAGIAAVGTVVAFVDWVFDPNGVTTFRWVLFLLVLALAIAAVFLRQGPRPEHGTQAVNVAGIALIALEITFFVSALAAALSFGGGGLSAASAGFGWKAIMILGSLGVIAYGALARERGPAYLGTLALFLAVIIIGTPKETASIVGWPLILVLLGLFTLAAGVLPRSAAGAPPPAGGPPPPAPGGGPPPPPAPPPPGP